MRALAFAFLVSTMAAGSAAADPRVASYVFRNVCLSSEMSPQALVDKSREFGIPRVVPGTLQDPTEPSSQLDFHQLALVRIDGETIGFSVRHRVLRMADARPVEWTECVIDLQRGGVGTPIVEDISSLIGAPTARRGTTDYWTFRISDGKPIPLTIDGGATWRENVQRAQSLNSGEVILVVAVDHGADLVAIHAHQYALSLD